MDKKSLILIIGILALFMIPSSEAILCDYNTRPYIVEKMPFTDRNLIYWSCYNITADYCISYVEFDEDIIQVNPSQEIIGVLGVGLNDKFTVNNGIANIYFTDDDLRENKNVTFGVRCQDEVFEVEVTPRYKPFVSIFDRVVFFQENAFYVFGTVFLLMILIIISLWLWRFYRK